MQPLHQPYPWYFPNATMMIINLDCDDAALADSLPDGFDLRTPVRTIAWTLDCVGIGGVGRYTEFMISTLTTLNGRTTPTIPFIYVNNDAAMASGREVLGIPKRLAEVRMEHVNDQVLLHVKRSGIEFASMGMTLDREGTPEDIAAVEGKLGRMGVTRLGDTLVEGAVEVKVKRVVHGRGYIDARPSAADQLYRLKPVASTATFIQGDLTLLPTREIDDA